jgi:dihydroorotate dehydrogenase (NAD+) catalytic subunit
MLPDLETQAPTLGTNLGYGGPWALPLTCHWLAKSRKQLGADFPLIGTNGARSGEDVARMLLAGASAVEMCSAVMTGGFGVLGSAVAALAAYLERKGMDAAALRGLAADRVAAYGGQEQRPQHWQNFVPPETLGGK